MLAAGGRAPPIWRSRQVCDRSRCRCWNLVL